MEEAMVIQAGKARRWEREVLRKRQLQGLTAHRTDVKGEGQEKISN